MTSVAALADVPRAPRALARVRVDHPLARIPDALCEHGPHTVPELAGRLDLTEQTVRHWLAVLEEWSLVQPCGRVSGGLHKSSRLTQWALHARLRCAA
jgi:DeoR/GlpR family transcriptional regulator of sugar metabolism